jgi:hypothetical protein
MEINLFFLTMRPSTSDENSFDCKSLVIVILNTSDKKKPVVLRKMTHISTSVSGEFPLTCDINRPVGPSCHTASQDTEWPF